MENNKLISKSAYLIHKQCPKYLWYYVNDRKNIPELDLRARFNYKAGLFTGSLAKKCFPEGIEVLQEKGRELVYLRTLELMNLRKPLFDAGILCKDACFFNGRSYGIYARADVLVPVENGLADSGAITDGSNTDRADSEACAGIGWHPYAQELLAGRNFLTDTVFSLNELSDCNSINTKEETNKKVKTSPGRWDVVEVKITTGTKKINIYDIAFQKYCFQSAGIDIRNCYLMNINTEYMLKGVINPFEMFKVTEVTEKIEKLNLHIKNDLQNMAEIISGDHPPQVNPGKFCGKPFNCPLKNKCWESIGSKSILFLYSINHKMIKKLNDSDIKSISDIPLNFSGINEKQKIQIEHTKYDAKYINKAAIANFLKQVSYPVFFLDFETFASPIPLIENTKPYQNIPFQFSLHVLRKPEGQPEYYCFLSDGMSDPRPALLDSLRNWFGFAQSFDGSDIGIADDSKNLIFNNGKKAAINKNIEMGKKGRGSIIFRQDKTNRYKSFDGTVIVYDETFERSIFRDLVSFNTEHVSWIFKVANRIVDLSYPFKNFYYYNPVQRGSASVKKVLPALTKKSYDEMAISNGDIAAISFLERSRLWKETISGINNTGYEAKKEGGGNFGQNSNKNAHKKSDKTEIANEDTEAVRQNLLEYCKLDTEGLYHIMQELEKLII